MLVRMSQNVARGFKSQSSFSADRENVKSNIRIRIETKGNEKSKLYCGKNKIVTPPKAPGPQHDCCLGCKVLNGLSRFYEVLAANDCLSKAAVACGFFRLVRGLYLNAEICPSFWYGKYAWLVIACFIKHGQRVIKRLIRPATLLWPFRARQTSRVHQSQLNREALKGKKSNLKQRDFQKLTIHKDPQGTWVFVHWENSPSALVKPSVCARAIIPHPFHWMTTKLIHLKHNHAHLSWHWP